MKHQHSCSVYVWESVACLSWQRLHVRQTRWSCINILCIGIHFPCYTPVLYYIYTAFLIQYHSVCCRMSLYVHEAWYISAWYISVRVLSMPTLLNSLWYKSGSTLAQVMAWCWHQVLTWISVGLSSMSFLTFAWEGFGVNCNVNSFIVVLVYHMLMLLFDCSIYFPST